MNLGARGFLGRLGVLTSLLVATSACSGDDGGSGDDGDGGPDTGGTGGATGGSASGSGGSTQGGSSGSTQGGSSGSTQGGSSGSTQGGSSGSAQGGSSGSAQGGNSGGTPPLFTSAPDCDSNVEKLEGTFQGTAVDVNQSLGPSTLDGYFYYTVSIGRSNVRLQWRNVIAPNVVQPLTEGGYVLTFWDTANPEILYCITAGEIGFLDTEPLNESFKYSITRVRSGEVGTTPNSQPATCDGEEITVDLLGCAHRD